MNALRTWYRDANAATRRASAFTAVLVAGLVVSLIQVPLPLQVRTFPVSGQSVVAHPDGSRLLVQQEHAIAIVDAATGEVTATVPLGSLVPGPGIAMVPATSNAVVLATVPARAPYRNAVTVTVDIDRTAVTSVIKNGDVAADSVPSVRSLAVDRSGAAITGKGPGGVLAVGADGRVWRSVPDGIDGVPNSGPEIYYHMSIAPDGRSLYAVTRGRALLVDTATGRIEQDIPPVYGPDIIKAEDWTVLLAADDEHVFINEPGDSRITVRTLDGGVVATVETGGRTGASGIALSPDGTTLYAALADRLLAVDAYA
ncbi:YncE family protein [Pseudonocardia sp. MH-G8]|uniref:YncE family protein n=1 Tax=Pseudonocardia sp. MH-G8 TaxID=1854588 RepID=UPI000B9FC7F6|nr:hypothetical protein [Pseudonocardia sp. MH-G8]OZM82726.1 hypothetical protein CFP66_08490 [Pseudonocardia sp. MH-G8]